jgi:hypothetical protein
MAVNLLGQRELRAGGRNAAEELFRLTTAVKLRVSAKAAPEFRRGVYNSIL